MTPRARPARPRTGTAAGSLPLGLLLAILLAAPGAVAAAETVRDHPDERLGALLAEVVALINAGDPDRMLGFVRERYGDAMLRGSTHEAHATFLKSVHDGKSPLQLCCFQLSERIPENMAVAFLHGGNDTWSSLQIRFDEADRITSLMLVPTRPPADFIEIEKLDEPGLGRELDAFLTDLEAKDAFTGAVLIARQGKPMFAKAYGLANREHEIPNRLDTRFNLGSMNKMFTAVAIAQLAERGKLSFDDLIADHLPDGWLAPEIGRQVRVRQLLNHTSGLGDFLERRIEQASWKFAEIDDYKEIVAQETLAFEPGSRWQYSNTGFLLLGVIVSEVSGEDYYDYIRENVYGPAGMRNTDSYEITRPAPKLADGYWKDEAGWKKNTLLLPPRGTSAGGGFSTVEDLLAFDVALRSNKLVSEETRDLLFRPDPERNSPSYGYGFMIGALAPDREVGHGGSFPGVSARLSMFLDSGYTFVALCNGPGARAAYAKALTLIERAGSRRR